MNNIFSCVYNIMHVHCDPVTSKEVCRAHQVGCPLMSVEDTGGKRRLMGKPGRRCSDDKNTQKEFGAIPTPLNSLHAGLAENVQN